MPAFWVTYIHTSIQTVVSVEVPPELKLKALISGFPEVSFCGGGGGIVHRCFDLAHLIRACQLYSSPNWKN